MSADRIKEIHDRLERVTEGEWFTTHNKEMVFVANTLIGTGTKRICDVYTGDYGEGEANNQTFNDCDFIANSKSDVEFLLNQISLLKRKLESCKEVLTEIYALNIHAKVPTFTGNLARQALKDIE